MKKFTKISSITLLVLAAFLFLCGSIDSVSAVNVKDQINTQLNAGAEKSGLKNAGQGAVDPRVFVSQLIKVLLTGFGIVFIILIAVASYWLVTSHNEEDKVKKAYKTIQGAIIGLIIVLLAYSIARLFTEKALEATKYGQGAQDAPATAHCCKVCAIGGLINQGCHFEIGGDRAACANICAVNNDDDPNNDNEEFGDCEYMGYIPVSECKF